MPPRLSNEQASRSALRHSRSRGCLVAGRRNDNHRAPAAGSEGLRGSQPGATGAEIFR